MSERVKAIKKKQTKGKTEQQPQKAKPPQFTVNFDQIPHFAVSGFFGGLSLGEGSISFFQDRLIPIPGTNPGQIVLGTVEHDFVANVKMSPVTFKRMALWMIDHVKRHEAQFGEIKIHLPPGKQKKGRLPDQAEDRFDYIGYQ